MSFSTAMLSLFLILTVLPSDVAANKCIINGTYIDGSRILLEPELGTLEEVGDKKCGFRMESSKFEFIAIALETDVDEFCSFWEYHSICVCSFFGCNSLTGVYYDTLIKSTNKTGRIMGEKNDDVLDNSLRDRDVLIRSLEKIYNVTHPSTKTRLLAHDPVKFGSFMINNSRIFPNETRKQELIQEGILLYRTTTLEPTTEIKTTSTTAAKAKLAASSNDNSSDSANSSNGSLGLIIGGVAFLVGLILIGVAVFFGYKFYQKRHAAGKKDQKGKTDSKSSVKKEENKKDTPSVKSSAGAAPEMESTIRVSLKDSYHSEASAANSVGPGNGTQRNDVQVAPEGAPGAPPN